MDMASRSALSLSKGIWKIYIAKTRTGRYYVGITTDTKKRIEKHNDGKGSKMAREQGPFVLVYESNPFSTKSEARIREEQIKRWTRAKKEKLINGEWK